MIWRLKWLSLVLLMVVLWTPAIVVGLILRPFYLLWQKIAHWSAV